MPFALTDPTHPRTNLWKLLSFWWWFFESAILNFIFKKKIFIPMKISPNLYDRMDGSTFWCFPWFPENSLLCVILRYTVYQLGLTYEFYPFFTWLKRPSITSPNGFVVNTLELLTLSSTYIWPQVRPYFLNTYSEAVEAKKQPLW